MAGEKNENRQLVRDILANNPVITEVEILEKLGLESIESLKKILTPLNREDVNEGFKISRKKGTVYVLHTDGTVASKGENYFKGESVLEDSVKFATVVRGLITLILQRKHKAMTLEDITSEYSAFCVIEKSEDDDSRDHTKESVKKQLDNLCAPEVGIVKLVKKNGVEKYQLTKKAPIYLSLTEDDAKRIYSYLDFFGRSESFSGELYSVRQKLATTEVIEEDDESGRSYTTVGIRTQKESHEDILNKLSEIPFETKVLSFDYKSGSTKETRNVRLFVGLLAYSSKKDALYLLGKTGPSEKISVFRADRILLHTIEVLEEENTEFEKKEYKDIFDESFDSPDPSELKSVKVVFSDVFNVREKLFDLQSRRKSVSLEVLNDDKKIVLRDKVRGLSDFAKYLRSFGSAVLVYPAEDEDSKDNDELVGLLKGSLERTLKRYEEEGLL